MKRMIFFVYKLIFKILTGFFQKKSGLVFLLLAVLVLAAGCFGNQDDGNLQSQLTYDPFNSGVIKIGSGTLAGFVVTDANNRFGSSSLALAPLAKARVTIVETGLFTYTDNAGYYEFLGMAPGDYTVTAFRTDTDGAAYLNYSKATVKADMKTFAGQSIVLKKMGRIMGRAVPESSTASNFKGFLITAENFPGAYTVSGADGYFILDAVPAGQPLNLIISAGGYESRKYGPVTIDENKTFSINESIIMLSQQTARTLVSGKIYDAVNGSLVADVFIKLYEKNDAGVNDTGIVFYGDSEGNFLITVETGKKYELEFIRRDYFNLRVPYDGSSSSMLIARMQRAKSDISSYYIIRGKTVDDQSKILEGVKIYTSPFTAQTLSDSSGAFKIYLPAGVYNLYAAMPGYGDAVQALNLNPYLKPPDTLEIVLQKNNDNFFYRLSGNVTDVNSNALIAAKVSIDKNKLYTYTNQAGDYFLYLKSGTYEILVSDNKGLEKNIDYFMGSGPQKLDVKLIKN